MVSVRHPYKYINKAATEMYHYVLKMEKEFSVMEHKLQILFQSYKYELNIEMPKIKCI